VKIDVQVVPNAPRSEVVGWHGARLKIRLHAPPVDGRANEELCRFIAGWLGVKPGAVRLARGASARAKTVEVEVAPERWAEVRASVPGVPPACGEPRAGGPAAQ
jgi:uncharacterized protein (TIGR00251 family)